jgi:hypothetical protein
MTQIDVTALLPAERLRTKVLNGEITQLHRGDRHAEVGDTFEIEGVEFEITDVESELLGEITDEDARAEGSPNLAAYKKRIEQTHNTEWDDSNEAVVHRFERVE